MVWNCINRNVIVYNWQIGQLTCQVNPEKSILCQSAREKTVGTKIVNDILKKITRFHKNKTTSHNIGLKYVIINKNCNQPYNLHDNFI